MQRSNNLAALKIALQGAAEAGATTELLDIRELSLLMYDPAKKRIGLAKAAGGP